MQAAFIGEFATYQIPCLIQVPSHFMVILCMVIFCLSLSKQFKNEGKNPEWPLKLFIHAEPAANASGRPSSAFNHSSFWPL